MLEILLLFNIRTIKGRQVCVCLCGNRKINQPWTCLVSDKDGLFSEAFRLLSTTSLILRPFCNARLELAKVVWRRTKTNGRNLMN